MELVAMPAFQALFSLGAFSSENILHGVTPESQECRRTMLQLI
jgi:hypothetical protein